MAVDPITLITAFAKFIGYSAEVIPEVIKQFTEEHPELLEPPPASPVSDLDPDVVAAIEDQKV